MIMTMAGHSYLAMAGHGWTMPRPGWIWLAGHGLSGWKELAANSCPWLANIHGRPMASPWLAHGWPMAGHCWLDLAGPTWIQLVLVGWLAMAGHGWTWPWLDLAMAGPGHA